MQTPSVDSPPTPPQPRGVLRVTWVLAVCSALVLTLVAVEWRPLVRLDDDIAGTTHRWAVDEPGVTHVMRILTDWVWDTWTMRLLCAVVVLWLWWRRKDRWTAVWLGATCLLGSLLQQGFKAAVDRPRPVWPDPVDSAHYAAFPSGHAMTATFVCGLLVWLLHHYGAGRDPRRIGVAVAVVSVAGVGVTRVWLGVHWATDVLGGWLLGALVVALAVLVHRRRRPRAGLPSARPES
ncbi:phosphatase PAP2 family protein [Streptomyces sp. AC512_CC834]|uniref:phosphatase PAP2 family protein n=1 Tax=Streptomyces sp. AC512_CC834 TaxID=2823691 RepID=UPI001C27914A|nr:phosphatase PAP2 family protein [Streptomyces sp. AC512_CC834]